MRMPPMPSTAEPLQIAMVSGRHGRPYYAGRILAEGYKGVKDLLAYRLATDFTPPEFMRAVLAKTSGIARILPLHRSQ